MRFLVDAQLPPALARRIEALGHSADHVFDSGLTTASDHAIRAHAAKIGAVIVTKDEDFAIHRLLHICKHGDTSASTTRVSLERGDTVLVVRRVPAHVCENCGEAYIDATAFDQLQRMLDEATGAGIQVEVREYAAA